MSTIIGVDIGTSVTKAVAYDGAGGALASASRRSRLDMLPGGRVEQDLDDVVAGVGDVVREVAAALVEPGMSVMLDDSTTVLVMAGLLVDLAPLTVVTNARRVLDVFAGCEGIRLIALGGEYSRTHDSFLGMPCVEAVEALSVDLVAVSTSALDARTAYHQEQDVVLVKRAMLTSAATKVMLMDHTKLARTALHRVGPVGDLDHLVVDDGADAGLLGKLRERTRVTVAAVAP